MTSTLTDNVQRMRELYDAFARGDVPTVLAAMDEAIDWQEAESGPYATAEPLIGPDAVVANVLARLGQDFEGFRIEPERFVGDGGTVVMIGRYKADRAHATGRPLDAQAVHVWDLRDGRLVRFRQYTDTRQWTDVLATG